MFEAVYVAGKDLTFEPYSARRRTLEKVIERDRTRIAST
jgi:ATP-dependent DNA ligase